MKDLDKKDVKRIFGKFVEKEVLVIEGGVRNEVDKKDPTLSEMFKVAQDNKVRFRVVVDGGIISHGGNSANRATAYVSKDAEGKWRIQDVSPG